MPSTNPEQLYPPERTNAMENGQLATIFAFALADANNDDVEYGGMTCPETRRTAWRTCADISVELTKRVAAGDEEARDVSARLANLL